MESLFRDSSPDYGPVKCEVNKVGSLIEITTEVATRIYKTILIQLA